MAYTDRVTPCEGTGLTDGSSSGSRTLTGLRVGPVELNAHPSLELEKCLLCDIISRTSGTPFESLLPELARDSQILAVTKYAVVVVDVAPVELGHALVIPKRHSRSTSDLSMQEFSDIRSVALRVAEGLKARTLRPVVFFEHGPSRLRFTETTDESCRIDHAHLHVTCSSEDILDAARASFEMAQMRSVEPAQFGYDGYLYLELVGAEALICRDTGYAPQTLRRLIVSQTSHESDDSWRWHDQIVFADEHKTRERVQKNMSLLLEVLG